MKIGIFDFNENRRKRLEDILSGFKGITVISKESILKEEFKQPPSEAKPEHFWEIQDINLIFLHRNNREAKKFFDSMCKQKNTIIFTGGYEPLSWELVQDRHFFLKGIETWKEVDISSFIREWGNKQYKTLPPYELLVPVIKFFSLLKHRIVHIFLPMDIDLQGIVEVLNPEFKPPEGKTREEWAKKYYKEAFGDENPKDKFEDKIKVALKEINKANLKDETKNNLKNIFMSNSIKELKEQLNGDFDTIKKWASNPQDNPFHRWFCSLMEDLKRELSKLNEGLSD